MKRDMDIVRRIALAAQEITSQNKPLSELPDLDMPTFAAHVQWMQEAGLLHAALMPKDSMRYATNAVVFRLTWQGCEFADSVRSDTLWAKAKSNVLIPTASWTFGVLMDWLKAEITNGLPKIGF